MAGAAEQATERALQLARYAFERSRFTLSDATADVPGYATADRDRDGTLIDSGNEWEALRKQFNRDIKLIEQRFGIAIDYDAEHHIYRTRPAFFTPGERHVLIAAMAMVHVEGINVDVDAITQLGRQVDATGRRVIVAVHKHMSVLRDAMAHNHPVRFCYHDRVRTVAPWLLGMWRNRWYLVGYEQGAGERRVYRLDRMQTRDGFLPIEVLEFETFEGPGVVDPPHELRLDPNDWGTDPPIVATVEVHVDHADRFESDLRCRRIETHPANVTFEIEVRNYEYFRDRIIRMGTHAIVRSPEAMVDLVRDWLVTIVDGSQWLR